MSINKIIASAILCKNYNQDNASIENILETVELNKDAMANFQIYLNIKILGGLDYHIFIILQTKNKMRIVGDMVVPEDDFIRDEKKIINYRVIYNMDSFDFPNVGKYEIDIYGMQEDEYIDFKERAKDADRSKELLKYLVATHENKILDIILFDVV